MPAWRIMAYTSFRLPCGAVRVKLLVMPLQLRHAAAVCSFAQRHTAACCVWGGTEQTAHTVGAACCFSMRRNGRHGLH